MTDMIQEYNRANTDLNNRFSDALPKAQQDLLMSISALDQAGRLKTIQDFMMAKRSLAPIINKVQLAQQAKLDAIKANNKMFEDKLSRLKNSKQIDYQASEAQGIFINKNGEPLIGQNGQPIKYESNAIKSSQYDEKTGKLVTLFADGRYKVDQISTPNLTPEWKQDLYGNWYDSNSPMRPDLQTSG